jgi:hypothetical protein
MPSIGVEGRTSTAVGYVALLGATAPIIDVTAFGQDAAPLVGEVK